MVAPAESILKLYGKDEKVPLRYRVSERVFEAFTKAASGYTADGSTIDPTKVLEAYMAWFAGLDCPDSDHITKPDQQTLDAHEKAGLKLPRYFIPKKR